MNKKLNSVNIVVQMGSCKFKKTVYGRHVRFSFLPRELFVLHEDMYCGFTITHAATGLAVAAMYDYGSCLDIARKRLLKKIQQEPFNHFIRRMVRIKNHTKTKP